MCRGRKGLLRHKKAATHWLNVAASQNSAKGMYEMPRRIAKKSMSEKAGTHWLNVGCVGTETKSNKFKFVVKWWKSLRLVAAQPNGAGPYQSQHAFVVKAFNRGSVSSMACGEHTSLSIFGSTSNMSLYVSQAFPWIVQSTRLQ